MTTTCSVADILEEIGDEVARANDLHRPLNSHHEAYAVLLEEVEEYWDWVKMKAERRDEAAMRRELIQAAAMCVRTIHNVCDRRHSQPPPTTDH